MTWRAANALYRKGIWAGSIVIIMRSSGLKIKGKEVSMKQTLFGLLLLVGNSNPRPATGTATSDVAAPKYASQIS
jgi:hypothetical protein